MGDEETVGKRAIDWRVDSEDFEGVIRFII